MKPNRTSVGPLTASLVLAACLAACQPAPHTAPIAGAVESASIGTARLTLKLDFGRELQAYKRYTRADIARVTVSVHRVDSHRETLVGAQDLTADDLGDEITFTSLAQSQSYRVRADAYDATDTRISMPAWSVLPVTTTNGPSSNYATARLPLRLLPFTPNYGMALEDFTADVGAPLAFAMDSAYFYDLGADGTLNRRYRDDLSGIDYSHAGNFTDFVSGAGGLFGVGPDSGLVQVLFDEEMYTRVGDPAMRFSSLAFSPEGVMYAATEGPNGGRIYRVELDYNDVTSGSVMTPIAGTDVAATPYGDGTGRAARFDTPRHLAFAPTGDLYLVDGHTKIRKVTPAGVVTTLPTGDLGTLGDLVVGNGGDLYVTSTTRHVVYRVAPDGTATVLAGQVNAAGADYGNGVAASFSAPSALLLDPNGTLFVVDAGNAVIRKID